jgi:hypothetical protein
MTENLVRRTFHQVLVTRGCLLPLHLLNPVYLVLASVRQGVVRMAAC